MNVFEEVQKIWGTITTSERAVDTNFSLTMQKKLLDIFHVGSYYYYIVNLRRSMLEYMGPEIKAILGHQEPFSDLGSFIKLIHPLDVPFFLNFESAAERFFDGLSGESLFKYKVQYDIRLLKADGTYARILHQFVIIHHDAWDVKTFVVDTDITHLKNSGDPQLSFIGLDGSPSYFNVDTKHLFVAVKPFFTIRQRQILKELSVGKSSVEISEKLNISKHTVDVHRKNMLKKTGAKSTYEILQMAFKNGWV